MPLFLSPSQFGKPYKTIYPNQAQYNRRNKDQLLHRITVTLQIYNNIKQTHEVLTNNSYRVP